MKEVPRPGAYTEQPQPVEALGSPAQQQHQRGFQNSQETHEDVVHRASSRTARTVCYTEKAWLEKESQCQAYSGDLASNRQKESHGTSQWYAPIQGWVFVKTEGWSQRWAPASP